VGGPGGGRSSSFSIDSSPMQHIAASSWSATGSPSRSFKTGVNAGERPVPPLLETVDLDPELTGQRVHGLAPQQMQGDLTLAHEAPALTGEQGVCGSARASLPPTRLIRQRAYTMEKRARLWRCDRSVAGTA